MISSPHPYSELQQSNKGILVAEAGCVLEALSDHLSAHGHIMPLDLGAKGRLAILQLLAGRSYMHI